MQGPGGTIQQPPNHYQQDQQQYRQQYQQLQYHPGMPNEARPSPGKAPIGMMRQYSDGTRPIGEKGGALAWERGTSGQGVASLRQGGELEHTFCNAQHQHGWVAMGKVDPRIMHLQLLPAYAFPFP